jgi:hypothetical protein
VIAASADVLVALEQYAGPLVCARGAVGILGARSSGGTDLHLVASSSSPQLTSATARCLCVAGRVLRVLGGDACEFANWRACVEPCDGGLLALGLGLTFTSARRAEFGGADDDDDGLDIVAADDVVDGTASMVVWLDPDVCEALATDDLARARRARCAAVGPDARFRLHYGGYSYALQHGAVLIVPPDEGSGGQNLRGMRVEAVGGQGGGGSKNRRPASARAPRLVGLHFFVSSAVCGACAQLGADGVRNKLHSHDIS